MLTYSSLEIEDRNYSDELRALLGKWLGQCGVILLGSLALFLNLFLALGWAIRSWAEKKA